MRAMSAASAARTARTRSGTTRNVLVLAPVDMELEARAEALVAEILGRGAVGIRPRVEGAQAARPAVRQACGDHRVLDAAAAIRRTHAARVEAGDGRAEDRDAGARRRAVDAADERR